MVSQNLLKVSDTKVIAVNLGLSSGICWGDRNIGAKSPEDFGEYFAWGETVPKSSYTWETYSLCDGSRSTQTKYCTNSAYGEVDDKAFLERANDVASTVLGSKWRMPTNSDFNELIQECKWRTVRKNGCICFKVTGPNGKSIYLPAAGFQNGKDDCSVAYDGFYWSSSLDEEKPYNAYYMNIGDGYQFVGCDHRELGLTVRAVTSM